MILAGLRAQLVNRHTGIRSVGGAEDFPTAKEKGLEAICASAKDAIEFYKKAFNAKELLKLDGPAGKLVHACIQIGNSNLMLVDESPE